VPRPILWLRLFFSAELKAHQAGEWEFFFKPVTANQQGPPVWTYSARSPGNIRSLGEIEGGGANILEAADIYSKAYLEFRDQLKLQPKIP
jgi:hypothetical protein